MLATNRRTRTLRTGAQKGLNVSRYVNANALAGIACVCIVALMLLYGGAA